MSGHFSIAQKCASTKLRLPARAAWVLAVLCALLLAALQPLHAQTEDVLYSFGQSGDGVKPLGVMIRDKKGNLYGTTQYGGANDVGTVFKLSPAGPEAVLHSFGVQSGDGARPFAGLVIDVAGNLYGTTANGGSHDHGTVFKLSPAGAETVLYSFGSGSDDGSYPYAGLIMDTTGNFYGTTVGGGANNGGTVFKLTPSGTETVLYSFCAQSNCWDGFNPTASLIMDSGGNLYGTTDNGGAKGYGTVFKVTSSGAETVLYAFCSQVNCADGGRPAADLIMDIGGDLYGTASYGGPNGLGAVFKLTPTGAETTLYGFGSQSSDGAFPDASLIMDKKGNLYGTTAYGGATGDGTVFEISPPAKIGSAWTETVLHSFCFCADGRTPLANLIMDQTGALYGTTYLGGAYYGGGAVYKISASTTITALSSSPNPSNSGQTVTLTAVVSGSGATIPTGKVTFKNGTTTVGAAILKTSGMATAKLKTKVLPVGSDSLTAVYDGDIWNLPSTSATLNQVVN